jgi:hypothetical protein
VLVVAQEDVAVDPVGQEDRQPARPEVEVGRRVLGPAQPEVDEPAGSSQVWLELVVEVGRAQGGIVLGQQVVDLADMPRRVLELDCQRQIRRPRGEQRAQAQVVAPDRVGHPKQDAAEPLAEQPIRTGQPADGLLSRLAERAQAAAALCLDDEAEVIGRAGQPARDGFRAGLPVEGVVELDGR